MPRTGTESLKKALTMLGYQDVFHGQVAFLEHPASCKDWLSLLKAREKDPSVVTRARLDQLIGQYDAVNSAFPIIELSAELLAAYPDAKVLMTIRDVDAWHSSIMRTSYRGTFNVGSLIGHNIACLTLSPARWLRPLAVQFFDGYFQGDFPKSGKHKFDEHYIMVRSLVPSNQLLEFNVKEGWGPICRFLDRREPKESFPFGNTTEGSRHVRKIVLKRELTRALALLVAPVAVISILRTASRYISS
ncbi:hypothetical protein LTR86_009971 [Recurvomyces mirabilis]|nr:hypothetical protein LTR86_009971 [Recurvomyces mirabilis]